jgi:hypothetical protein
MEKLFLKLGWWCGPFALGSCSLPLWHKSPKTESLQPFFITFSPFGKRHKSEDYTKDGEMLGATAKG